MKEASLLHWVEGHLQTIKAEHLLGKDNLEADWPQKHKRVGLESPPSSVRKNRFFGRPEINLFASRENAQVSVFLSWTPDPLALGINTLILPWPQSLLYAFPMLLLIQVVLQ